MLRDIILLLIARRGGRATFPASATKPSPKMAPVIHPFQSIFK